MNFLIIRGGSHISHVLKYAIEHSVCVKETKLVTTLEEGALHSQSHQVDVVVVNLIADELDNQRVLEDCTQKFPGKRLVYLGPVEPSSETLEQIEKLGHCCVKDTGNVMETLQHIERLLGIQFPAGGVAKFGPFELDKLTIQEMYLLESISMDVGEDVLALMLGKSNAAIIAMLDRIMQRFEISSREELMALYKYLRTPKA